MENDSNESSDSLIDAKAFMLLGSEIEKAVPEIFVDVPKEKRELIVSKLELLFSAHFIKVEQKYHRGPLPSPQTLKEYAGLIDNAPERIFALFEKQSNHRIELEKKVFGGQATQSKVGQFMGFSIAVLFLAAAFTLIVMEHDVAGTILGSVDLVALVSLFVLGRNSQRKDGEKKEVSS